MRVRLPLLYLCFLFSGLAALVYEIVWQRQLTLVMGVSTWSIAAVLTAYMAGLALGAWAFSRIADRARNAVRVYAVVELGIAACALGATRGVDPLMQVYVRLATSGELGFYLSHLIRFGLSLAVLIVPCTLIGATVPLMGRIVTRHAKSLGVGFGRFYAVNTFGAVLGAAAAGFFLIRLVGMHAAVYVAAGGNLLAGLTAMVVGGSLVPVLHAPSSAEETPTDDPRRVRTLYALAAIAGLTGLGYEIAWSRLLAVYTLNSVYVFTMLLTVFLTALALGSALGAYWMRRRPEQTATVAACVQMLLALTGPLVLLLTRWARHMGFEYQYRQAGAVFLLEYQVVAAVVFLPALLLGMTLPLLAGLLPGGASAPGRWVGRLYALNSLGSILGAAITGVVLIPMIGLRATLMLFALVNFAAGCWIATRWGVERVRGRAFVPTGAVVVVAVSLLAPVSAQFIRPPADRGDAVVYYAEGENAIVHVAYTEAEQRIFRTLYLDSQSVAGDTKAIITDQKMLAHLPLLLHPAPTRALTVGFGTGGTSFSMLLHDVETHCVEIERAVPAASRYFVAQNHGVATLAAGLDPTRRDFTIILDDARSWLQIAPQPYDVIVNDLTSIQYRGNGNLYTRECFEFIRDKLTADGVGCAWVPITGIGLDPLRMLVRTFREVFPHTSVWYMSNEVNDFVILVGMPQRLSIDIGDWRERMDETYVARDLASIGLDDAMRLATCLLLDENEVACFTGPGEIHTDDRPLLDYLTHAGVYQDTLAGNLRAMLGCQRATGGDVPITIAGATPAELADEWDLRRGATQYVLEGHCLMRMGDSGSAHAAYAQASDRVPADPEFARLAGRIPLQPDTSSDD